MKKAIAWLFIVAVVAVVGWFGYGYVTKTTFVRQADALFAEFQDAEALAGQTSRISLAGPIGEMQAIRRKAQALPAPPPCDKAKSTLVRYMDATLDAYLTFQGQGDETVIKSRFSTAAYHLSAYRAQVDSLR